MSEQGALRDLTRYPPPWLTYAETKTLFSELEKVGGHSRFVGGCVRDALLGEVSDDLDVCTDLLPEIVLETLEKARIKVIPTGFKHGTVTAILGRRIYEITTLRTDTKTDGRHAEVAFTKNWQNDAARRDFTINALYMDLAGTLYDFFSGVDDLAAGRVKFIGNADQRIEEDRLRILRFFRFFSRFGRGTADQIAVDACRAAAHHLDLLSSERVSKELLLLLGHPAPLASIKLMQETGVLKSLFQQEITSDILEEMVKLPAHSEPICRLGALTFKEPSCALDISKRLRLSSKTENRLILMCENRLASGLPKQRQKEQLYRLGAQVFRDRLLLSWAQDPQNSDYQDYSELIEQWSLPAFPLSGRDLLRSGIKAGPDVGILLSRLENLWVESDFSLSREKLLAQLPLLNP